MIQLNTDISEVIQGSLSELPPRALDLFSSQTAQFRQAITQSIEITEHVLGEQILAYDPQQIASSLDLPTVAIVCKGHVRLLVHNGHREITAELLEVDRCFGGDHILVDRPFAYRAVASGEGTRVAKIPLTIMVEGFDSSQQLRNDWLKQAQVRERLSFFKIHSSLRSHTSHQLSQWMPLLQTVSLAKGKNLASETPANAGRYWLRSGEIAGDSSPALGDSWGYSTDQIGNTVDSSWVVQNDAIIYQLPISAWAIAKAFTPDLDMVRPALITPSTVLKDTKNGTQLLSSADPSQASRRSSKTSSKPSERADNQSLATSSPASPTRFPKPPQRFLLDPLRQYPWVEQQSSSDCGAACLSMVSRYWGKRFPLNVLREKASVGRDGTSLKSLAKAAEGLGFQARPVRASLGAIAEQKGPWIAHWEGNHYVVVYKITAKQVLIADPALGHQRLSRQTFAQKWSSYGLLLEPTLQLQKTDIKQGSLGRYMRALLPYRGLIAQIIAISLLIQCFGLISPLFTQVILDRVVVQKSLSTLNVFVVGLLIFGLWGLVMGGVRQYLLSYFSNRLDLTLISGFIRHTVALPMRFFESRRVGDIVTRVQENQKIQQFLIGQVVLAWLSFLTGFVYLGLMFYYNRQLTMLVLLLVPPIAIMTLGAT
ncbi:MAG: cysteine peptidase family C39 domain-containing protein, partial [Phormidesmis sp.]